MSSEVEAFASSVRQMVEETSLGDDWSPGRHTSDHNKGLTDGLADLGWHDVLDDPDLLPFVGAAALELGRAAASPEFLVELLGGSPLVNGLAMYGDPGRHVAVPNEDGFSLSVIEASTAVNFIDSLGVYSIDRIGKQIEVSNTAHKIAVWESAVVGYFAGLSVGALDLAISHARQREIFGKTLAHLSPVQQRLASSATIADALQLSAVQGAHGLAAIADASSRTWEVMNNCNLVFGAIGYTLEFPMQRFSRRTKALGSFVSGWIDLQLESAA